MYGVGVHFFVSFHSQSYSISDSRARCNDVTILPQRHDNFLPRISVHSLSNLRLDKFAALTFQRFLQPSLSSSARKGELQGRNFWKSNWSSILTASSEFSTALSEILDIGKGRDVSWEDSIRHPRVIQQLQILPCVIPEHKILQTMVSIDFSFIALDYQIMSHQKFMTSCLYIRIFSNYTTFWSNPIIHCYLPFNANIYNSNILFISFDFNNPIKFSG